MITVTTFLWHDPKGKCNSIYTYDEKYVITLKKQIDKYLTLPHEFVCVTNFDTHKLEEAGIRCVPLDMTTFRPGTRYAKLQIYSKAAQETIGKRILCLDLDTVIVGNINHLVDRSEDTVLWRNPNYGLPKRARYNTSIVLHTPGTMCKLYNAFENVIHSEAYSKFNYGGTDQRYLSYIVGDNAPHWTDKDGVYGLGRIGDKYSDTCSVLPDNACIVFTPGRRTQYSGEVHVKHPWIKQYIL